MQNSYIVAFKEIAQEDIGHECPFLPDNGEFELHFAAIAEDVSVINGITYVGRHDVRALLVKTLDLDIDALKYSLKPILQNHFCHLRISNIEAQ